MVAGARVATARDGVRGGLQQLREGVAVRIVCTAGDNRAGRAGVGAGDGGRREGGAQEQKTVSLRDRTGKHKIWATAQCKGVAGRLVKTEGPWGRALSG